MKTKKNTNNSWSVGSVAIGKFFGMYFIANLSKYSTLSVEIEQKTFLALEQYTLRSEDIVIFNSIHDVCLQHKSLFFLNKKEPFSLYL